MSNLLNTDALDIQLSSITRYFQTYASDELNHTFYKHLLKLNKTKKIEALTEEQLNNSLHHLQDMENIMYCYYWCISFIEKELLRSLLSRKMNSKISKFHKNLDSPAKINRTLKLAKQLINLKILANL